MKSKKTKCKPQSRSASQKVVLRPLKAKQAKQACTPFLSIADEIQRMLPNFSNFSTLNSHSYSTKKDQCCQTVDQLNDIAAKPAEFLTLSTLSKEISSGFSFQNHQIDSLVQQKQKSHSKPELPTQISNLSFSKDLSKQEIRKSLREIDYRVVESFVGSRKLGVSRQRVE